MRRARRSSSRLPRTSAASSSRASGDRDLGERRQRRGAQHLLAVDPHPRHPVDGRRKGERVADQLAAGLDLGLDLGAEVGVAIAAQPRGGRGDQRLELDLVRGRAARPRAGSTIATGAPASSAASSAIPRKPSPSSSAVSIREWRSRIG